MAYTTSVAGTAITASWANANVRDQGVSVFTDATARTAAVTVPVDGMISNLTTTDRVDVYNGSSWSALVAPSNGVLTTWTPAVTESGSVTVTVTRAVYQRTGRQIEGDVELLVTGAGSANNPVTVSTPVTAAYAGNATNVAGSGLIFDSSANLYYPQIVVLATTSTFRFVDATIASNVYAGQTGSTFAVALASPDRITFAFHYEAAADG